MNKVKNIFIIVLCIFSSNVFAEELKYKTKEDIYISCVETYMKGLIDTDVSNDQIRSIHEHCRWLIIKDKK